MFGGNKPTGFGTPFGASTGTTGGFGTGGTTFGQSQPVTRNLFGGTPSTGGLFGGNATSSFGQQQSTPGFSFGTPTCSGGLFGQKTTASAGLFSTPAASSTNTFGFLSSTGFGTTTSTAAGGGLFGTSNPSSGGLFGASTGFGQQQQQQQQQSGTVVKFNPPQGQDTMVKNGVTQNINTKHQCITAMKEYETKSLEELRIEDYTANRKGKQPGSTGFGFGATQTSTQQSTGFGFGQTNKPAGFGTSTGFGTANPAGSTGLFGTPASQPAAATTGLFGQNKGLFGTTTTQPSGFGFGQNTSTSTGTGLFGQTQQNKPLFGSTPASTQPSLFGTGTSTFGAQPAASTGFGGFGTSQPSAGGLFNKPAFGAQTTAAPTAGFGGFGTGTNTGSNLFAKPFSTPSTGFGAFNNPATQSTGFGLGFKPTFSGLTTTTAAPSFNLGGGLGGGNSLFGNQQTNKPTGFGTLGTTGTTGFTGFGNTGINLGAVPTLGGADPNAANATAQLQQTLLTLTHSPYGDSPLFWNMKESSTKREEVLKPTNPAAQKALLANQHKVSPRPMSKIKPKALSGVMNGNKSQLFDGLEEDEFSFGSDTFQPRKSFKKLTLKKYGMKSGTSSLNSSVIEDHDTSIVREEDQPSQRSGYKDLQERDGRVPTPDSENIIRSKNLTQPQPETSDGCGGSNIDDTIAILNARNKYPTNPPPTDHTPREYAQTSPNDTISHDESTNDVSVDERPMTPPPPHPAGIVLTRPGYYTIPSLEALSDLVDDEGNCYVEDFTIGREGYGSIFFPGITNITNMNFDEIVFFRRKEVIVYPDDDNKPDEGEGLNKKAEITLDCVWPRDKSLGTSIRSPEKLKAMQWQGKIEANSMKIGAKFIDYRPETGSWVFEVKHFSKYGLLDDSDDEDVSGQDKKRLRLAQQQQMAVQKQKIAGDKLGINGGVGDIQPAGDHNSLAKFTIGPDDDSEGSGRGKSMGRMEVPMGDDETADLLAEQPHLYDDGDDDIEITDEPSSHRLATSMGVDAHNMQFMKASFFGDDDIPAPSFGRDNFNV